MHSSEVVSQKPHYSRLRWFTVIALSCSAAVYVYLQSPEPTWVSEEIPGGSKPVGFTSDELLISLDSAENVADKSRLRIREAATGKVVQEHVLGEPVNDFAELTPDQEWVILRTPNGLMLTNKQHLKVVSWRTGLTRCPPIPVDYVNPSVMSHDGRYKLIYFDQQKPNSNMNCSIVDLTTGKVLYPITARHVLFSPDVSQWVAIEKENDQRRLVFHAIEDGREVGRSAPLEIAGSKKLGLDRWTGDRLAIEADFYPSPGEDIYDRRVWSFHLEGTQLSDMRAEPAYSGRFDNPGETQTWWDAGEGWAARHSYSRVGKHFFADAWNGLISRLSFFNLPHWPSAFLYQWQLISPESGRPLSPKFYSSSGQLLVSKDARWLADGGKSLRVWSLSPAMMWKKVFWMLFAAAIPWTLMIRLPSKRRGTPSVQSVL